MLDECNAFLPEVEKKTGSSDSWWEKKENTQLLARLPRTGNGTMSFHTAKQTLLFQGKGAGAIRTSFVKWRSERLEHIAEETEKRWEAEPAEQRWAAAQPLKYAPPESILATAAVEHCGAERDGRESSSSERERKCDHEQHQHEQRWVSDTWPGKRRRVSDEVEKS